MIFSTNLDLLKFDDEYEVEGGVGVRGNGQRVMGGWNIIISFKLEDECVDSKTRWCTFFGIRRLPNFSRVITSRRASKLIRIAFNSPKRPRRIKPSSIISSAPRPPSNTSLATSTKHSPPSTPSSPKIPPIFSVYSDAARSTKRYQSIHPERQTGSSPQRPTEDLRVLPRQPTNICL